LPIIQEQSLPSWERLSYFHPVPVKAGEKLGSSEMMRLHKTAATFAAVAALIGWLVSSGFAQTNTQLTRPPEQTRTKAFSDTGKAALSRR